MHGRVSVLGVVLLLALLGCSSEPGSDSSGPSGSSNSSGPEVEVRAKVVDGHDVTVAYRTGNDPWSDPERVLTLDDRECGDAEATTSGERVAVTVKCDDSYYDDQAPTRSVALVGEIGSDWEHHDLDGEAYDPPAVSPSGGYAVWSQGRSLLRWSDDDGFEEVDLPSAAALAIDDDGEIRTADFAGAFGGPTTVRITDGSGSQDVDLPSGTADDVVVYDSVVFRGDDQVVVGSESSDDDLVLRLEDGRWVVQE